MLLNLDLIPINSNASVRDGEALLLVAGLDLDLHDSLLEESHVEIEMGGTELQGVGEVFVLVKMKSSVDRVLMNDQAIRLDIVSCHQVVALETIFIVVFLAAMVLVVGVTSRLVVVAGQQLAKSVAVVFDTARLGELSVELIVAVVAV